MGREWVNKVKTYSERVYFKSVKYYQIFTSLTFESGRKVFPTCSKCHLMQASPEHIFYCFGLALADVRDSPHLELDFARVYGLMDLI